MYKATQPNRFCLTLLASHGPLVRAGRSAACAYCALGLCARLGDGKEGARLGRGSVALGLLSCDALNANPGLANPWLMNRGVFPFSGDSDHFWREHPLNMGRVYYNPGST